MKRKSLTSTETLVVPTENQMDHALAAFALAKDRYKLVQYGSMFVVHIAPENYVAYSEAPPQAFDVRQFPDEASARQWREREIIREAITAGMRAKP